MAPVLTPPDHELSPAATPLELELGVIKEAQRRRRRRQLVTFAVIVAAAALFTLILNSGGGAQNTRPTASRPRRSPLPGATEKSPAAVFAKDPYMGVACHIANSIACDRVGLAVWLRRPATTVSATIAGASLKLNDPTWSYVAHDGRQTLYVYAGFLQPAGLTTRLHVTPESRTPVWLGNNAPSPLVRFRIDYGHGNIAITQEHVWLSAGWG